MNIAAEKECKGGTEEVEEDQEEGPMSIFSTAEARTG